MTDSVLKIYDLETFPNYFLAVGNRLDKPHDEYEILENPSFVELFQFVSDDSRLTGFNNHGFDDLVIAYLFNRVQAENYPLNEPIPPQWAYDIGQQIIDKEANMFMERLAMPTEDVMKYRDFETNTLNLKSFANMLNLPIIESCYPFGEPLSEVGKKSILEYCKSDVFVTRSTMEYLDKKGSVEDVKYLRNFVAQKLEMNPDDLVKSGTNSLMIRLFKEPSYDRDNFFKYIESCNFDRAFGDPAFKAWYDKIITWVDDDLKLEEPILEFIRNNVLYKFALGGGHGHNLQLIWENLFDSDFASLYPNILINILGLGETYTALYKEIVDTRVASKKTNPRLAGGLKLAINSLYGLTRSATNGAQLYNPYLGLDICIAGQVILYDLCLRLEEINCTLVNVNTDGIIYDTNGTPQVIVDQLIESYSKQVNISIDTESMDFYRAKDVNNYFVFDSNGFITKRKGIFSVKPFYNNLASPKYVMNHFISQQLKEPSRTIQELYQESPQDFVVRAKNTRQFELFIGLEDTYDRYGKTGKLLKKKGIEFYPYWSFGRQFRGFAVRNGYGYNLRNLNHKTGKYVEIGVLKTKKYNSQFSYESEVASEEINFDYYLDQAEEVISVIETNQLELNKNQKELVSV